LNSFFSLNRILFLVLAFLLNYPRTGVFAQVKSPQKNFCDDAVIIYSAAPKSGQIQGYSLIHTQCSGGHIFLLYEKSSSPSKRVDVDIYDSGPTTLAREDVKPYAAQILGMKSVVISMYGVARNFDKMVASGQIKGNDLKKLATIKPVRGFDTAVGLEGNAPDNIGGIYCLIHDRFIITVQLKYKLDFSNDHDLLFDHLSPFLEAINLPSLNN
jgi:hypothetical protein